MGKDEAYDFVVLGGGVAGLTFALESSRKGKRIALLEKGKQPGGLARTVSFGEYRFDVGCHGLRAAYPDVIAWLADVIGDELLEAAYRCHMLLNGRYVHYPLQFPDGITAFSFWNALQAFAGYLVASLTRGGSQPDVSFEDWVVRRSGRPLYEMYFRPFTEKTWGLNSADMSGEFARQRLKMPGLGTIIKERILRRRASAESQFSGFLYPTMGFGTIPDRIAESAQATGLVTIYLDSEVFRLGQDSPTAEWRIHYRQRGQEHVVTGEQVISTIPLPELARMLKPGERTSPPPTSNLDYRSVMCVCLAIEGPRLTEDLWTYFPDHDILFGRTYEPLNWSPNAAPPGFTSLCAEIFCSQGDEVWERPDDELIEGVLVDLTRLGLVERRRVQDAWLIRAPNAYPLYRVGYADELRRMSDYLAQWPTLHVAGRTGAFQYLDVDGVIRETVKFSDTVVDKE